MDIGTKSLKTRLRKRKIVHGEGNKNVRQVIGPLVSGMEIYGINNGQFSFINIIEDLVNQIVAPVNIDISSWTMARFEITRMSHYLETGQAQRIRFLTDRSFPTRHQKEFEFLRSILGQDNIRVLRCHCKFALIYNERWNLAIRTSMNLNQNKRLENFEISDDKRLTGYMRDIVDELFATSFNLKGLKTDNLGQHLDDDPMNVDRLLDGIGEEPIIG